MGLINIRNIDDNECFQWNIVRYLNPADCNQEELQKLIKNLLKSLIFKNMKFPVKIRDILKIEKKNSIGISIFGYENKEKHPIYV